MVSIKYHQSIFSPRAGFRISHRVRARAGGGWDAGGSLGEAGAQGFPPAVPLGRVPAATTISIAHYPAWDCRLTPHPSHSLILTSPSLHDGHHHYRVIRTLSHYHSGQHDVGGASQILSEFPSRSEFVLVLIKSVLTKRCNSLHC